MLYRPPSEGRSLIVQVTIGCSHNQCTFCTMYRDKRFRVRKMDEIKQDLDSARGYYRHVERLFLADGDALVLSTDKLVEIMDYAQELFPEIQRISVYGSPQDILRKSHDDLVALRQHGMAFVYIGAESGNDEVLRNINKGATRAEIIEAVQKVNAAGLTSSVTFISGIAQSDLIVQHARDTGTMISEMEPDYVSILTLMVEPGSEIYDDIAAGRFQPPTPQEALTEYALIIDNINVTKECIFRSNHASNYLPLRGTLPQDKDNLLAVLQRALDDRSMLRPEMFRAL